MLHQPSPTPFGCLGLSQLLVQPRTKYYPQTPEARCLALEKRDSASTAAQCNLASIAPIFATSYRRRDGADQGSCPSLYIVPPYRRLAIIQSWRAPKQMRIWLAFGRDRVLAARLAVVLPWHNSTSLNYEAWNSNILLAGVNCIKLLDVCRAPAW